MLKKTIIIFLVCGIAFAFGGKLENHWAKEQLNPKFMEYYFPQFVQNDYANFAPDGILEAHDFHYALMGLCEVLGYRTHATLPKESNLTRAAAALELSQILSESNFLDLKLPRDNSFTDLTGVDPNTKAAIAALNAAGIMQGYSATTFAPKASVTQSQGIIILQRVEQLLTKNLVPFKFRESSTSYSQVYPGVTVREEGERVLVSITRRFPTPGYKTQVERVERTGPGKYTIYTTIKSPAPDAILIQVITYQTTTIEIEKKDLDACYQFEVIPKVEGLVRI